MTHFDISSLHNTNKGLMPKGADLDSAFTFFYDETNNIRKFHVKENNFNYSFQSNFVLGGIVYDEPEPNIDKLFSELNLESSIKEVKLKYIAKGDFLSCLKSPKLKHFLNYLLDSRVYVHYSSVNLLYYSIVDIVDSVYANLSDETGLKYLLFMPFLKDKLYRIAKLEINSVINLFHRFQYPNLKEESIPPFIDRLTSLFEKYENTSEFYLELAGMKEFLRKAKEKNSLPFIMDEEDFVLLKNFSNFYLRPIYLFKNSTYIFDKEDTIKEILDEYVLYDGETRLESYSFEDSKDNLFIQASDIFVGLLGKISTFINTHSKEDLESSVKNLSTAQLECLDMYLELVGKSIRKNVAFFCPFDSIEELSKLKMLYQMRNKLV